MAIKPIKAFAPKQFVSNSQPTSMDLPMTGHRDYLLSSLIVFVFFYFAICLSSYSQDNLVTNADSEIVINSQLLPDIFYGYWRSEPTPEGYHFISITPNIFFSDLNYSGILNKAPTYVVRHDSSNSYKIIRIKDGFLLSILELVDDKSLNGILFDIVKVPRRYDFTRSTEDVIFNNFKDKKIADIYGSWVRIPNEVDINIKKRNTVNHITIDEKVMVINGQSVNYTPQLHPEGVDIIQENGNYAGRISWLDNNNLGCNLFNFRGIYEKKGE